MKRERGKEGDVDVEKRRGKERKDEWNVDVERKGRDVVRIEE